MDKAVLIESMRKKGIEACRVLDLTDEKGLICGKVLADLGAEVIKVERPGGDAARNIGPFYHDIPDPEKSLYWFAFNTGKKSISLDIETVDGRDLFKRLTKTADFVIESFPPGYMEKLGLGYAALSEINPGIIMTSITPFGQSGPYAQFKGPDMVVMAMGGVMYLYGEPDREPIRISLPQAYLQAGTEAAVGSIIAHYYRETTGEGQHVDVSAQECVTLEMFNAPQFWDINRINLKRQGAWRQYGPHRVESLYPCKDGYIQYSILGGRSGAESQRAMVDWMNSEGMVVPDWVKEFEWESFDAGHYDPEIAAKLTPLFKGFLMTKTKAELFEQCIKRRLLLGPVSNIQDLTKNPQLTARDFWVEIDHPELGVVISYPGPPCKSNETPWKVGRRAPFVGEHNSEIYEDELGLSKKEFVILKGAGVI